MNIWSLFYCALLGVISGFVVGEERAGCFILIAF